MERATVLVEMASGGQLGAGLSKAAAREQHCGRNGTLHNETEQAQLSLLLG